VEFGDGRDRASLERQPPKIGEHAHEILSAAGYSEQEIIELRSAGVLGAAASVLAWKRTRRN
jgi:crotonobetainyl-CoA:carnitine CoA-transferase CaiB-like acyl-CoA transferase